MVTDTLCPSPSSQPPKEREEAYEFAPQMTAVFVVTMWNPEISNSMQQSPWETYTSSVLQEVPHIFWNLKFHYHLHNSLPLVTNLSYMKAPCILPTYHLWSILILSSHLHSGFPSSFFRFSHKIPYAFLIYFMHVTCPTHVILSLIILIYGLEYKSWHPSLHNCPHPPGISSLLGNHIPY